MNIMCVLFIVKQKTAVEMRMSDWCSDVCSSDLVCRTVFDDAELVGCSQVGDRRARGDCTVRDGKPEPVGDRLRKRRIDVEQMRHDPRTDIGPLALGEFEHKGVAEMLLRSRSDTARVGKVCVSTCRSRWVPF